MLVDTDVHIRYLRGTVRASEALQVAGRFSISVVPYMEPVHGKSYRPIPELDLETLRPS